MKKYPIPKMIALFAAILCFGIANVWGADLYVDATSAEYGDGASWETAYTDLQDALAAAGAGDTIHVAHGTYIPGSTRDATFGLDRNLTLLGGYPVGGGDRDPVAIPAVLSGEIGEYGRSDNIHHVVIISGGSAVTLDGFTITGGNAVGGTSTLGGGVLVSGGQVVLENVKFMYNEAEGGGGLQFYGESLTLSNVRFFANVASKGGGGLHFSHGALVMNRVAFDRNKARDGGGLYFTGTSSLDLDDVTFIGNLAFGTVDPFIGRGGGICINNVTALDPPALGTMANVTLHNNWAYGIEYGWGGGIFVGHNTSLDYVAWDVFLTNVTLSGNNADGGIHAMGGGICIAPASRPRNIYMSNVTLHGNLAKGGDGDNGSGMGGGMSIFNTARVFMSHVTFAGNTASGQEAMGGGVFGDSSSMFVPLETQICNSIFWGNTLWGDTPDQLQGVSPNLFCIVEGYSGTNPSISNVDPVLGNFGFYGGLTPTIPLLEGSSAIDAAMDPLLGSWWIPDTDQRGELRPQRAGSDIGAYEASVNLGDIFIDPADPAPVSTTIASEAGFTDALSETNAYTATWDWGDGSTSNGVIDKINGTVTGNHSYAEPGVYMVGLEVREVNEGSGLTGLLKKAVYQYVVVYDPAAGFVTGGGWFVSPAGAYADDPSLAGVATFGFVSKYKKDADVPTGNTAFEFAAGDLYFHSTSYEWLVVTGSDYAKFKGVGTINGMGDYRFMLWAGDGDPDTFRIRIWEEDEETAEETDIYDNGFDQALGGGSIVIHTNGK